jgi:uncharacterized protein
MKFTLDSSSDSNLIRSYSPNSIRLGDQEIRGSCIVTADHAVSWEPASFAELRTDHLEKIFALAPDVVLLGTGMTQRFAPPEIRSAFAARKIGLEAMDLGAACRTFNILVQEERKVAAALLLR